MRLLTKKNEALKRLVYVLLMYSTCIITPFIDVIFIPIKWIITGSVLRQKVTKGKKTFYVYTIMEVVYYSMNKYLTKLLKL